MIGAGAGPCHIVGVNSEVDMFIIAYIHNLKKELIR